MLAEARGRNRRADIGVALKTIRLDNGWTLAEVAERTGFSISTLSKVENGKQELSYTRLMKLGQGLGVDIARLLTRSAYTAPAKSGIAPGARAVTRAGSTTVVKDDVYAHICHAADLLQRSLHPMITEVHARSIEEFGELRSHPGEEFSIVIEGAVDLYSEEYAPVRLETGDSIYFDSGTAHAFVAAAEGPCRILSVFLSERPS